MTNSAMKQEAHEIVGNAEGSGAAVQRQDWSAAATMLTEVQDRVERLLREVADREREANLAPKPEESDRS